MEIQQQDSNFNTPTILKKKKKEVETTSVLFITRRAKQDPIFYHLFCDIKYHDGLGLLHEDLKEFNCLYMPILVKLAGERIHSIPAAA